MLAVVPSSTSLHVCFICLLLHDLYLSASQPSTWAFRFDVSSLAGGANKADKLISVKYRQGEEVRLCQQALAPVAPGTAKKSLHNSLWSPKARLQCSEMLSRQSKTLILALFQ